MLKKLIVVYLTIGALCIQAQHGPPADTAAHEYGWKHGLVGGLTLTHVSFKDWTQGGENALSWTATADGKSIHNEESVDWSNSYKLAFGQARLGNLGLRKTEDRIELESILLYKAGGKLSPFAAATMKTQFAKGYVFEDSGRKQVSQFFDPAYLTQSVGVSYQPIKELKTRLGVGLREILTNRFNQYADDPATPEVEKTLVNGTVESVTSLEWHLEGNLLVASELEVFFQFSSLDNPVVRNLTTVTGKINKYFSAILSVQLIKEPRVSPRTQIKESIALGISYAIFLDH